MSKRKSNHIDNLEEVDTIDEYAQLKTEISDRVRAIGVNCRCFPVDGCVSYSLEADGTLWMMCPGRERLAPNRWTSDDWRRFAEHVQSGLWEKLEALKVEVH
jgi:hypothetical protein